MLIIIFNRILSMHNIYHIWLLNLFETLLNGVHNPYSTSFVENTVSTMVLSPWFFVVVLFHLGRLNPLYKVTNLKEHNTYNRNDGTMVVTE